MPSSAVITDPSTNSSQLFFIRDGKARVAVVQLGAEGWRPGPDSLRNFTRRDGRHRSFAGSVRRPIGASRPAYRRCHAAKAGKELTHA